jgi:hypothetical protein
MSHPASGPSTVRRHLRTSHALGWVGYCAGLLGCSTLGTGVAALAHHSPRVAIPLLATTVVLVAAILALLLFSTAASNSHDQARLRRAKRVGYLRARQHN